VWPGWQLSSMESGCALGSCAGAQAMRKSLDRIRVPTWSPTARGVRRWPSRSTRHRIRCGHGSSRRPSNDRSPLSNDRSPAPGAHPSRGRNTRRALTTPHLGDDGLWIGPAGGVGWIVTSCGPCKRSALIQITDRRPDSSFQASPGLLCNPNEPDAALRLVTVARWTLSMRATCTPRVGPSARLLPSWAFIGAQSANSSRVPASPCVRSAHPLVPPPLSGSWSCVTKA
jgi:hypothetical protein